MTSPAQEGENSIANKPSNPRLTSVSHMARMYPKDPPWPSEVQLETSFGGSQNLRLPKWSVYRVCCSFQLRDSQGLRRGGTYCR